MYYVTYINRIISYCLLYVLSPMNNNKIGSYIQLDSCNPYGTLPCGHSYKWQLRCALTNAYVIYADMLYFIRCNKELM